MEPPTQEPDTDRSALVQFLQSRWVMSLATTDPEGSYSAPLFYASTADASALIFLSDPATRHGRNLAVDPRAAAAVYIETADLEAIRGAQLLGRARPALAAEVRPWADLYRRRFPAAGPLLDRLGTAVFYVFEPHWAKLTDNQRGFGHKTVIRLGPEPEPPEPGSPGSRS